MAFASLFASVGHGAAQAFDMSITGNVTIDGDTKQAGDILYINKKHCDTNATLSFDILNLNTRTGATVVELWSGQTGSQDCFAASGRTKPSGQNTTPCKQIGTPLQTFDKTKQHFDIKVLDAFSTDGKTCELGKYTIYVVPLMTTTPTTGVPSDGIGKSIYVNYYIKIQPLPAPLNVKGGSGDTDVKVKWSAASGADAKTLYKIYYDADHSTMVTEGATGPCPSTLLVAGQAPMDGVESVDKIAANEKSVDPSGWDTDYQVAIPVAVTSIDAAGNESVLSNLACVVHTKTNGFWEKCDANCKKGFDTCSASPWNTANGLLSGLFVAVCGLGLFVRRRRNV